MTEGDNQDILDNHIHKLQIDKYYSGEKISKYPNMFICHAVQ